jgi:hypothetical protein
MTSKPLQRIAVGPHRLAAGWAVGFVLLTFLIAPALAQRGRPIEITRPAIERPGVPRPRALEGLNERQSSDYYMSQLWQTLEEPESAQRENKINSLLRDFSEAVPGRFLDGLGELLKGENNDTTREPLSAETPNLLVTRARDPKYNQVITHLRKTRLDAFLERKVNTDKITLVSFVFSSAGQAKLENEIPLAHRARSPLVERVSIGEFDQLDANMFESLRGKIVIFIGHIAAPNAKLAFEVRRGDGARRYVSLDSLQMAARKIGFDVIPLGCETADTIAVGTATKITDLDAIDGFKRAIAADGARTYKQLLADISGSELKLSIDLTKVPEPDSWPIEFIDRDGRSYQPTRPVGSPQPSSPQGTASADIGIHRVESSSRCELSVSGLNVSVAYARLWPTILDWWMFGAIGLGLICVFASMVEVATISTLRIKARYTCLLTTALFSALVCLAIYAVLYAATDGSELFGIISAGLGLAIVGGLFQSESCLGGIVGIAMIVVTLLGFRANMNLMPLAWLPVDVGVGVAWGSVLNRFPDHHLSRWSAIALIVWGIAAVPAFLSVIGLRIGCFLVDAAPV